MRGGFSGILVRKWEEGRPVTKGGAIVLTHWPSRSLLPLVGSVGTFRFNAVFFGGSGV